MKILMMGMMLAANIVFAVTIEELQQQFETEKSVYEQKISELDAAKKQASDADQQLKSTESSKTQADQYLKEEEQSYDLAVQLAKRKKQPVSDQAQQELSAAQTSAKQAIKNYLKNNLLKTKPIKSCNKRKPSLKAKRRKSIVWIKT